MAPASLDVHGLDAECLVCFERLAPFWKQDERVLYYCCGAETCLDCNRQKDAVVEARYKSGVFNAADRQLAAHCPKCRRELPDQDLSQQVEYLIENSERGKAWAQFYLGVKYCEGEKGVVQNDVRGIELLSQSADQGFPLAQFKLGLYHWTGQCGLVKSLSDAERLFRAAAEQGDARARYNLCGLLDEDGRPTEAVTHLKEAVDMGNDLAMYTLGSMYEFGAMGQNVSKELAKQYYTQSAEKGNAKGQYSLGLMLHEEGNLERAIHYLSLGAEQGDPKCCFTLGEIYMKESPASKNFPRGMQLLRRAKKSDDSWTVNEAAELLPRVEARLKSMCLGCARISEAGTSTRMLRCTRCQAAYYCSKKCQINHWHNGHKEACWKHDT